MSPYAKPPSNGVLTVNGDIPAFIITHAVYSANFVHRLLLNIRGILDPHYGTKDYSVSTFRTKAPAVPRCNSNGNIQPGLDEDDCVIELTPRRRTVACRQIDTIMEDTVTVDGEEHTVSIRELLS
ncbi:hypothetical protein C0991_009286 [Blastosporella zonata]|nr:hypothetical protein C0991_009286 [Blastosporella zonata]